MASDSLLCAIVNTLHALVVCFGKDVQSVRNKRTVVMVWLDAGRGVRMGFSEGGFLALF